MLEISIRKCLGEFALDVEVAAPENQIIVLFGPSGAGKSLTLGAIAGFITPDAGRIFAGGRVLFDSDRQVNLPPQQRHIGLVKQGLALFPHLTVQQNIAYGLFRQPASRQGERVEELLRLMNLDGLAARYPAQLSGGQQQRVALARALAPNPSLLLLDEPFSALDAPTRMQLRDELLRVQRQTGVPVLFVTHDLGEAHFLADRLAVIDRGKVLQMDTPREILSRPSCLTVARAIGVRNILPGTVESSDRSGCRVRVADVILNALPSPFEPGTPVHICLRSERVMLLRPDKSSRHADDNEVVGEIVRDMNDGLMATLFFRAAGARFLPDDPRDYDLHIELPLYIFERLDLARQRRWTVLLRKRDIQLVR
jgi:molybdate transport system ATP-binding protein